MGARGVMALPNRRKNSSLCVPDDDISVGFRPLRALLVRERIVQFGL